MARRRPHGFATGLTDYGDPEFSLYLRRSFARSMGYGSEMLERPIVGITNTASGFNSCHRHVPELIEATRRGVLAAGGLPLDFPTTSLGEVYLSPTSLVFRNLMSMDVEEMIRAQPMDAVVLIGGCDKTIPALLMGAASANRPAVLLPVGPMMTSRCGDERLGACTDCRRFWAQYRAGDIDAERIRDIEGRLATTTGTCPVMGTASTMACLADALGISLPGAATIPAVHADRLRCAEATGALAATMARTGAPRPRDLITAESVDNALRVLLAIGGSTNAIIHLTAIAGRCGIEVSLQRLNALSDETPVLVDLKPSGEHYMEDLHAAGGMDAVLAELQPLLRLDCRNVAGDTLDARLAHGAIRADGRVVRSLDTPYRPAGGLVALFGSLAPRGAILKRSAATPALLEATARAVVFNGIADLHARIDDPDLDVDAGDVLVLTDAGPRSPSGMPEAGYLPIPAKLARRGVHDMLRLSDARMSGTAFGTIILHVTPEAAAGGPLSLVRTGDRVRVSVAERRLDLLVSEADLAERRRAAGGPSPQLPSRGYARLHAEQVLQADQGCDLAFLVDPALHRRP